MYMLFLMLHTYMVLVDFDPNRIKPMEIVMVLWIFTFFVDEMHTVSDYCAFHLLVQPNFRRYYFYFLPDQAQTHLDYFNV